MVAALDLLDMFQALGLAAITLACGREDVAGVNDAARRLLGMPEGTPPGAWLERLHPADREAVREACRASGASRAVFRVTADELSFHTVHLELRPQEELTLGLLVESAARVPPGTAPLEALIEALPFEVWERDTDGVLIRQNSTCLRNWGTRLGTTVESMELPEKLARLWASLNARALSGEVVSHPIDHELGGHCVSHINLVAPVSEGERIRGVVGVNIDITATKEAERQSAELVAQLSRSLEELALAQATLVRRERLAALGELAAVVAHEVRNPLAAIYTSLSTLKRQVIFDRDAAVLFGILEEEAERLNRTVSDLLNYVRPLQPERRPDDLAELVRDVVRERCDARPEGRGELVAGVIAPAAFEPVHADPILMRVALSNLVANAIQAMPEGGRLTVTLADVKHEERDAVTIAVRDDGIGIPAAVIDRVFEPFFTTRASGAGIGLAVVRRIVEAHEGQVTADSDPDRGTTFTIFLPR